MQPFSFHRAESASQAVRAGRATGQGQTDAATQFLAGGTTLVDLMKLDVLRPRTVVDIMPLSKMFGAIELTASGLRLGAFATMAAAAEHPLLLSQFPLIAQSLQITASAQLRNTATLGGNVLQRTRCAYFRDPTWAACNKRVAGSGCSAIGGANRNFAVLGVNDSCISQYPGDFAVALVALDAKVELVGPDGARTVPLEALHRSPGDEPQIETTLAPGEIITAFDIPSGAWTRRSTYLKVRDRASYEFALASAAVALDLDRGMVRNARIGLGGMAYRPWRAREAEALLVGAAVTPATAEAAARAALANAVTHGDNDFKPDLARRTLVQALLQVANTES